MEEEFTFDVKIDQGLSGKKSCTIIVSLKDGTLRFCKVGDLNGTKFGHHQVRAHSGREGGGGVRRARSTRRIRLSCLTCSRPDSQTLA